MKYTFVVWFYLNYKDTTKVVFRIFLISHNFVLYYFVKNKIMKTQLSNQEQKALQYLRLGNSRKMIASELNIKNETLNKYFKTIYKKLEVNSATSALLKAYPDD